jgi:CHAT domain
VTCRQCRFSIGSVSSTVAEDSEHLFPWRSGSWPEAVAALRALVTTHTWEDVQRVVNRAFEAEDMRAERARQRVMALGTYLALMFQDPDDQTPELEASRRQRRGELVTCLCDVLSVVANSARDPHLAQEPLLQSLVEAVRAVSVEDVECIYDFSVMDESARLLAEFLLIRSRADNRYDDFRMGLRIAQLQFNGTDILSDLAMGQVVLTHLLQFPTISDTDAEERIRQVRNILPIFLALSQRDALPTTTKEIVQRAAEAKATELPKRTSSDNYLAARNRLARHFRATGNTSYVEDLLLYCGAPRSNESPSEAASRFTDIGVFLNVRGRALGRRDDLVAALTAQFQAIDHISPEHPSWTRYRANAATYYMAVLEWDGESVAARADVLRGSLPDLGDEPSPNVEGLAAAYIVLATVEFHVALAAASDSGLLALDRSIEAASRSRSLLLLDDEEGEVAEADALLLILDNLRSVRAGADPSDIDGLVCLVADSRLAGKAYGAALAVVSELIDSHPHLHPLLQKALQRAAALTVTQRGDRLMESFQVHVLIARVMLHNDEIEAGDRDAIDVKLTMIELLRMAATVTTHAERRDTSSAPLAIAESLCLEAAVQFIESGHLDVGVDLAALCTAVMANNTVLLRKRDEEVTERIASAWREPAMTGLVCAVPGWGRIVILLKVPGNEWTVLSSHPADLLDAGIAEFGWLEASTGSQYFALRRWLEGLAPIVERLLGDAFVRAQGCGHAVFLLPAGKLLSLPPALLAWSRPEVALPVVVVPGPPIGRSLDMIEQPFGVITSFATLVGASELHGTGAIDVEAELKALRRMQLPIREIRSFADADRLQDVVDSEVIHYTGHLISLGPDDTALTMADGSELTSATVRGLTLSSNRLVTLMACYSSFGGLSGAGQVQHLAGAFLEAGAEVVIAALWPTADLPARLFSNELYAHLAVGVSIRDAFAAAVDAVRNHEANGVRFFGHPVHWAGFTLYAGTSAS